MREFFRVIERVERGREFEPTVGEIFEEDVWERVGEKESEENADGEETQVVFCSHLISSSGWSRRRAHFVRRKVVTKFCVDGTTNMNTGKKKRSGAQKRKKKKEKEELGAEMERLKLGPTELWTGLVLHHKDVFVSHVLSKLTETDRFFFGMVNRESRGVFAYAGVDVLRWDVRECTSISMLEWMWNHMPWGEICEDGTVRDQAWFCAEVAVTNKLEFLKWAREVKQCEWDEWTINEAVAMNNLEMLKYCFSNGCPYDEGMSCKRAAGRGHLDCLRFLFDKVEPSRKTEENMVVNAACSGHMDIMKYLVEERKIADDAVKIRCVSTAAMNGRLDCLKYLIEDAKAPLTDDDDGREHLSFARYYERTECVNYLREKGCPEPTEEEYAEFVEDERERVAFYEREEERQSNTSSSD